MVAGHSMGGKVVMEFMGMCGTEEGSSVKPQKVCALMT